MAHNDSERNDVGPLTFTPAHYEALGKMLVAFQRLELSVTTAIGAIVEPMPHKKKFNFLPRILDELSFATRLKLLSNIVLTTDIVYFVVPNTKYEVIRREEYPEHVASVAS